MALHTNQQFIDAVWARPQSAGAQTFAEALACYKGVDLKPPFDLTSDSVTNLALRSPCRKVRVWNHHTIVVLHTNGNVSLYDVQSTAPRMLDVAGVLDIDSRDSMLALLLPSKVQLMTESGLESVTTEAFRVSDKARRIRIAWFDELRICVSGGRTVWMYGDGETGPGLMRCCRQFPGPVVDISTIYEGLQVTVYDKCKVLHAVGSNLATSFTGEVRLAMFDACYVHTSLGSFYFVMSALNSLDVVYGRANSSLEVKDLTSAWLDPTTGLLVYATPTLVRCLLF